MGRPRSSFPAVSHAQVGGVFAGSHTLSKQAEELQSINRRALRRLDRWLRDHPNQLPDGDWVEVFRYASASLTNLLREQRERAQAGGPPVPTDVLVAQLKHEFTLAAGTFDDADLAILARNLRPEAWATLDRLRVELRAEGVQ